MKIKRRPILSHSELSCPRVLQRIYASRGILSEKELDKSLQALLAFSDLKDIDKVAKRLEEAIRQKERILIIGDFDADGATSSALAVSALRAMGAHWVDFLVPNRFEFGYGLTPGIVEVAKLQNPSLIVTVDNGIASVEGVARANELDIDVLVTDHHLPPDILPNAAAIVNPNQQGCKFQSKAIAGVGVIFYVMLALRRQLMNSGWFEHLRPPNMAHFLDLVALGTVADVVPLDQNNRVMIHQGLLRIRQGLCRPGLQALIEISGKESSRIRESDLGFSIAPRLNAAGRLDDMSLGIQCLLCDSLATARTYAIHLDELNAERRRIEGEMKEQAMMSLEKIALNVKHLPEALCLFDESWHQGVIGILAGRLKERYHRPVFAFAEVAPGEVKGSARSVSGLNIRDVLASIDKDNPGLMTKFGGHAMAAGLSMPKDSLEKFKVALVEEVKKHLDASMNSDEIITDGSLSAQDLSLELAVMLQEGGPWGQQFPEPLFDDHFIIIDQRIVGLHHLKLTLQHSEGGDMIDAIAFNVEQKSWPNHRAKAIHAVYKLDINHYQGRVKPQLILQEIEAVSVKTPQKYAII